MDTHGVQLHYWNQFTRLKRDAIYINRYHAKVEGIDRALDMFAAIASSTAIGGWAVWNSFGLTWAIIIAASQVLTAVKPFLPFKARLKALAQFGAELDALALVAETDWLKVARLSLSDDDIHQLTMALKRKSLAAQQKAFAGASLPEKPKWVEAAEREATAYVNSSVPTET